MIGIKVQDCATLDYKNNTLVAIPNGTLKVIGGVAGFINTEILPGHLGAMEPVGGQGSIWQCPKQAGDAFDAGDPVYYDPALDGGNGLADAEGTNNGFLLGYAVPEDAIWTEEGTPVEVAASSDTYVLVYTGLLAGSDISDDDPS